MLPGAATSDQELFQAYAEHVQMDFQKRQARTVSARQNDLWGIARLVVDSNLRHSIWLLGDGSPFSSLAEILSFVGECAVSTVIAHTDWRPPNLLERATLWTVLNGYGNLFEIATPHGPATW